MKSEFTELSGMAKTHPWLALMLALFMFAVSGFPPTAGFFGKFYLFSSAVESGFVGLAVIGVLNSLVSVYYYFRVIKTSYFDEPFGNYTPATVTPMAIAVIIIAAVGTLSIGLFPEQLMNLTRTAVFAVL
jgi:NADH-quinone oxidoreductase subunit N